MLTALLLSTTTALAAGSETSPPSPVLSPLDEAARRQLYREGQALGDVGNWAEAAEKFRKVVALRSAPKALIALGLAEERSGHLIDADDHYRRARDEAVAAGNKADAREAQDARSTLAPRIPRLVLTLPTDVNGIEINVDTRPVTSRGGEVQVDPGERTLVITAPKRVPYHVIVKMKEGDRQAFSVALPLKPAWNQPLAPVPSGPPTAVVATWAAGGVVSIAGIAPLVIGANSSVNDGTALTIVGAALIASGLMAAGVGTIVWRVDASGHQSSTPAVQVTMAPGRDTAWIGIRGSF
jgi:hypothetical protein